MKQRLPWTRKWMLGYRERLWKPLPDARFSPSLTGSTPSCTATESWFSIRDGYVDGLKPECYSSANELGHVDSAECYWLALSGSICDWLAITLLGHVDCSLLTTAEQKSRLPIFSWCTGGFPLSL